jgi:hypothetical protein
VLVQDTEHAVDEFSALEAWMIPRVYHDFLCCTAGVHPTHAAKVAWGEYVGVPEIPFGSTG